MTATTQPFDMANALTKPIAYARADFERAYLEHHLAQNGGNVTNTAKIVGLERTHMYRKMEKLSIENVRKHGSDH